MSGLKAFNLTVLSNNCMQKYLDNTLSQFTNDLPVEVILDGEWSVAITEIHINKVDKSKTNSHGFGKYSYLGRRTSREVINRDSVLATLNEVLEFHEKESLAYKLISSEMTEIQQMSEETIVFVGKKDFWKVHLNNFLVEFYGKLRANGILYDQNIKNKLLPDEESHLNTMFIYTDLIKHRMIGDKLFQCIKMLVSDGDEQLIEYKNPEYYPLQRLNFNSISISMLNDQGEKINFHPSSAPTMITLHFKKEI